MTTYLVKVEGTALEITAECRPAWRFTVVRAVKAESPTQARVIVLSKVAREWAARQGRSRGTQPRLQVLELQPENALKAWWKGRGDFEFAPASQDAQPHNS